MQAPAPAPSGPDRSRTASLGGGGEWSCPFPSEADTAQIDEAYVTLQVDVKPDGTPGTVRVVNDPGNGFGREARRCAMNKHYASGPRSRRHGHPGHHEGLPGSLLALAVVSGHAVNENDDPRAELASIAASLRAYLEWQRDAGTVGFPRRSAAPSPSIPTSTSTPTAPTPNTPATSSPNAPPPAPPASAAIAVPAAAAAAAPAQDKAVRLPQLAAEVSTCTKCVLSTTRTQTVFARGNPDARLCFVGEAPGADEDEQGLPFVGRAGQLLDRMIAAMGLDPARDVYVCNILKCRPPANRRPEPEEMAACFPYLHEQLALVRPRVIVALGNTAVAALLDTKMGITKLRGQWKLYRGTPRHADVSPVVPPAAQPPAGRGEAPGLGRSATGDEGAGPFAAKALARLSLPLITA